MGRSLTCFSNNDQNLLHFWFGNPVNSTLSRNRNLSTFFAFCHDDYFPGIVFQLFVCYPINFYKDVSKDSFIKPWHWLKSLLVNYKHIIIIIIMFPSIWSYLKLICLVHVVKFPHLHKDFGKCLTYFCNYVQHIYGKYKMF